MDYTIRQEIIREVKRYMITLMNVKYVECCSQNCVCKLNRSSFTVLTLTRIPRILPLNFFFFSKDEKANFFVGKKKFWNYLLLLWHFVTRVTAIMSFFACHTVTLRLFFFFFCDRFDSYNVTIKRKRFLRYIWQISAKGLCARNCNLGHTTA